MSRKIGNVGVLDLRKATEASVKEIAQIQNVGLVLYSPETAPLMAGLNIGNMGSSVEVGMDYRLFTGQYELAADYLKSVDDPISIVVTGEFMVNADVTPEMLENSLKGLIVIGQILVPENLASSLQKKLVQQVGQMITYPENGVLTRGAIIIEDAYLESLEDNTVLVAMGALRITGELNLELFDKKIKSMKVSGSVLIREEYKEAFFKKVVNHSGYKLKEIPAGYRYITTPLNIDAMTLKRYTKEKLFTRRYVLFSDDIDGSILAEHIEAIRCGTYIICPAAIHENVFDLCPDSDTQFLPYSGKLMIIEGDHNLSKMELEYTKQKLNIIVLGDLMIDDDVESDLLFEKIDTLDNFGDVIGDSQQLGVLKIKLRTRKGDMVDRSKDDSTPQTGMSNVGHLTL